MCLTVSWYNIVHQNAESGHSDAVWKKRDQLWFGCDLGGQIENENALLTV